MQSRPVKLLFVCLGNICRSPMAQAICLKVADNAGLSGRVKVDSAGTSGYHAGESPDYRTLQTLDSKGLSLHHHAREITQRDFTEFDFVICMDSSNMVDLITRFPEAVAAKGDKVFLIRDHDLITDSRDVPDPYWGGKDGFENVYRILLRSTSRMFERMIQSGVFQD